MRHALVALLLLAVLVAACGGTAAPPATPASIAAQATAPAATPAPASPVSASPVSATSVPTSRPVRPTPTPVPSSYTSAAYGYTIDLPASAAVSDIVPATDPWNGTSAIGSNGPMVDQFRRTGSRLAFILSAPTDLDLDAYAAAIHAKAVREHGCSEEFMDTRNAEIDGIPARVVAFACQGLRVYEATMVYDGIGLIAKQITPPLAAPDLLKASVDDFVAFLQALKPAR